MNGPGAPRLLSSADSGAPFSRALLRCLFPILSSYHRIGLAMFRRQTPRAVKAYWWNGRPNFGDAMAPLLIERFTSHRAEWERVGKADVVSVGSVLEHLPPLYDGFVVGTGRLYPDSKVSLYGGSQRVLALRGPLTARAWPHDVAIGDPGLLANELVGPQTRTTDLGIVPHWSDSTLARSE